MDLMKYFADAQMMHGLSTGEKLIGCGITAVMGMGVTFMILLFLWGSTVVLAKFMEQRVVESQSVLAPAESQPVSNPPVHIAVIAAAVTEYETESNCLRIRKIRRLPDRPAWSNSMNERKVSR